VDEDTIPDLRVGEHHEIDLEDPIPELDFGPDGSGRWSID
jgi:hypothetical protein